MAAVTVVLAGADPANAMAIDLVVVAVVDGNSGADCLLVVVDVV